MKSRTKLAVVLAALALFMTVGTAPGIAHSIDYVSTNISPAATFAGNSGNWTVTNSVTGGTNITFTLTFSINTQGNTTTYPRTVTFGASTQVKPSGASDAVVSPATPSCTFTSSASTCPTNYTITAPITAGTYTVKIQATSGTGGPNGLGGGNGVAISFTVAQPVVQSQSQATTLTVSVGNGGCVVLHSSTNVSISATLVTTDGSTPVVNKSISFSIDSSSVGSAFTDVNGVATIAFNPSALALGDHTVTASFAGDSLYEASGDNENLGVMYVFVGFQQPINADGTSIFSGRTIPTKIRITDALNAAITNAAAYVFFAEGTPTVIGTDAEPVANTNGDTGNMMRYDYTANQYILNWDIAGLTNGTYSIRVDLGEGSCGAAHTVVVSLQKKGSK